LGGEGLAGGVEEFRDDGLRGGVLTALTAGGGQIVGGLLFVAGAATPLAAATAIGVMTVATTVKWANGPWAQNNGYESTGQTLEFAEPRGPQPPSPAGGLCTSSGHIRPETGTLERG
ncbi:MAG TPA: DoxX family membrane protein, partial [Streptosporangiaceae bacterium]|nr:DoxX family membrane protein [Streptosporangiaceae bacterium]